MEKTQNNEIRNEKGDVTTDNAEMQMIIRDYHKQLYTKKKKKRTTWKKWMNSFLN